MKTCLCIDCDMKLSLLSALLILIHNRNLLYGKIFQTNNNHLVPHEALTEKNDNDQCFNYRWPYLHLKPQ